MACGAKWEIDAEPFVAMSRLCAKVDSSLVQDGHDLYHHVFILSRDGDWAVVQQGMNGDARTARRYQWLSREDLDATCEPHTGITCDRAEAVLNLVAGESGPTREATVAFTREGPDRMAQAWKEVCLSMPGRHYITPADVNEKRLNRVFRLLHESQPDNYKDLVQVPGVGPRTVAALTLVSEIVYDAPPELQGPCPLQLRPRREGRPSLPRRSENLRPLHLFPQRMPRPGAGQRQGKDRGFPAAGAVREPGSGLRSRHEPVKGPAPARLPVARLRTEREMGYDGDPYGRPPKRRGRGRDNHG